MLIFMSTSHVVVCRPIGREGCFFGLLLLSSCCVCVCVARERAREREKEREGGEREGGREKGRASKMREKKTCTLTHAAFTLKYIIELTAKEPTQVRVSLHESKFMDACNRHTCVQYTHTCTHLQRCWARLWKGHLLLHPSFPQVALQS
jgi:hypothetical protein